MYALSEVLYKITFLFFISLSDGMGNVSHVVAVLGLFYWLRV